MSDLPASTGLNDMASSVDEGNDADSRRKSREGSGAGDSLLPGGPRALTLLQLALITCPWFGVQFSWSAEFATQTPYILSLGVPATFTTWTWAAGAVTGFVVQPIVGSFSDRCESKYGRRRPFLVWGAVATVLSQLMYAWSDKIGAWLGDTPGHRPVGIAMAVVSVWFLGCAINVIQTPLRAIIADIAPESQQELGQSISSIWQAIGGIVGFLVGYIWDPLTIMRPYFVASATALVATTTIACFVAKEKRHVNSMDTTGCCGSIARVFSDVFVGITKMPTGMRRICYLQFATWAAWFAYNPNWPAWMGQYIYGGATQHPGTKSTPQTAAFARGQQLGGLGQAIASGVQCVCSFLVPSVVRMAGLRSVYVGCFLVFVASFVGMGLLPAQNSEMDPNPSLAPNYAAVALMAATGIPLAATNIFPFSIIGRDFGSDPNLALYMGSLNIFIVLPQLLDTLYSGKLADEFGWNVVLLTGAAWTVIATGLIFFLKITKQDPRSSKV